MEVDGEQARVAATVERLLGPGRDLTPLGRGTDHAAYAVDTDLVARVALGGGPDPAIAREAALLGLLSEVSPLPVPEVIGAAPEAGVIVVRRLPGTSLLDEPGRDAEAVVDQLAPFLDALHTVPASAATEVVDVGDAPLEEHLAEAQELLPSLADVLGSRHRTVAAGLADDPPPGPPAVLLGHGDLGAEHLLAAADRITLTGVIDWSDAALIDPAHDVGRILRDLGPAAAQRLVVALPTADPDLLARAVLHARCALVEDLAFGLETGDRRYTDAALTAVDRTFSAPP